MPALARVIPWLVLAFASLGMALGFCEWSHPPFTDAQIQASRVDTWEVAVSTMRVFAVVFIGLGSICIVLARKASEPRARTVSWLAAAACLLALALFMRNHLHLTERTQRLTGESVGPVYGLL